MSGLIPITIAAQLAVSMPVPEQADIAWVAEGEFCEPETVLALPDDTLLVSNVCDFRTPGNGFLSLLDADGGAINWHVVENLDAQFKGANGIHISNDDLFVGGERFWHVGLEDNTVTRIGPDWLADIDGIEMEPDGTLQITPMAGPLIRFVPGHTCCRC